MPEKPMFGGYIGTSDVRPKIKSRASNIFQTNELKMKSCLESISIQPLFYIKPQ
jgi:hypothetical protein